MKTEQKREWEEVERESQDGTESTRKTSFVKERKGSERREARPEV